MATFGWHTLSAGTYNDDRFDFLISVEEGGDAKELPYIDSVGIATIGIGFNLKETSVPVQQRVLSG